MDHRFILLVSDFQNTLLSKIFKKGEKYIEYIIVHLRKGVYKYIHVSEIINECLNHNF